MHMDLHIKPLLKIHNLKTYFHTDTGVFKAVDGVSFEIYPKEVVGLVGESGCGKSITSLSILSLIEPPGKIIEGDIIFEGNSVLELSRKDLHRLRGGRISMIFQEPMTSLNPVLTCGKQIREVILSHMPISKSEAKDRSIELLKLVRLPDPKVQFNSYPHQLSGGMRQRIMIAIALASQPSLLIADEPTTALDVTVQADIVELLLDLKDQFNMAILFISHDLGLIGHVADRIFVMYAGQIVEEGSSKTILETPKHPYTKALIGCSPDMQDSTDELPTIPGTVPLANQYSTLCRFKQRCEEKMDICDVTVPKFVRFGSKRKARCLLYTNSINTMSELQKAS